MGRISSLQIPRFLKSTDSFVFSCNQCGKCCRTNRVVKLTPFDCFQISQYLKITPLELLQDWCDYYIDESSKLPAVKLKAKIYDNVCVFLTEGKCEIQQSKPTVCALYPIERVYDFEADTFYHFLPSSYCRPVDEVHVLKEWLKVHSLAESENVYRLWWKSLDTLITKFQIAEVHQVLSNQLSNTLYDEVYTFIFLMLYIKYDTTSEYLQQFEHNMAELFDFVTKIRSIIL